jgi:uncharacterized protein YkwD
VLAASGLIACVEPEPAPEQVMQVEKKTSGLTGVPVDGYPNYQERLQLVAINRARSDPNNVAAGTSNACSDPRAAVPPMVYDHDLGQAARFHCLHSTMNDGGLSHASYCTLRSDLEASGCTGAASCSCEAGTECWSCTTVGGCGTGPSGRMNLFGFTGSTGGETGAAGYSDSWSAVRGWVTEDCNSSTQGHRYAVTSPSRNVVGTGYGSGGSCWSRFYFADYGSISGLTIPRIASGIHRPQTGGISTNFTFYGNYHDPIGDPTSIYVVIDGDCRPMSIELGLSSDSVTYEYTTTLASGCREYYYLTYDSQGVRAVYPETGSFQVTVSGGANLLELSWRLWNLSSDLRRWHL